MSERAKRTTTDSGIPATSDEFSLTPGPQGPIALHDHYVVQKMQHFNRERVPERVVHAKGSGAHGFFEVTEDVSQFTRADMFNGYELGGLIFAVLIANHITSDGESNWFEGVQLLALYAVLGLVFYFA